MTIGERGLYQDNDNGLILPQKGKSILSGDGTVKQQVGDVNSKAKGSGARYNSGKPDYSLIPLCTLEDEARVWEYGAKKYARNNWMKGMNWSIPAACLLRHLAAWQRGESVDAESGISHIAHILCNARMLMLYEKTFPEGDDRPTTYLEGFNHGG